MRYWQIPSAVLARRALAFAGLASLITGLILIPAASHSSAAVRRAGAAPVLASSQVTVKGPRMYDPATGGTFKDRSEVTVSQTKSLLNQVIKVSWKNFTPSSPNNSFGPFYGFNQTFYAAMVVECRGLHPSSWNDCSGANDGGVPLLKNTSGIVLNTAYAVTDSAGQGATPFDVQTRLQNLPLGCDQNHPCSLVVVPGQGGEPGHCGVHTGDVNGITGNALAETTFTFGAGGSGPCSWASKIVVPFHFAPVASGCPQANPVFSAVGSPMLGRAMGQWLTGLCGGKSGLTIAYTNETGEQLAVQEEVQGASDVAFTSRPASAQGVPTGNIHYFYAPVAVSAAAVAYWMDNNTTGQELTGLKLNQRMLVKLLTTSYDPAFTDDPNIKGNPFKIIFDPEFKTLDPTFVQDIAPISPPTTIPTVMQGGSDMTWTVTRWIAADPTAEAFIHGAPAPGGMHINKKYKNVPYPTNAFIPRDPSPEYQRLYNPVFGLNNVVNFEALNADAGSNTPVVGPHGRITFGQDPPQPVGNRSLIALIDEGDAALDGFPVAAIPNTAGKYVVPTNATMNAALAHMISGGNGTLQVNLANKDPQAYPLTMVIYAMVPTSGIKHSKATAIARFLNFAAGPGQTPGVDPGQLPSGYLPLPPAMRAQTKKIAAQVAKETAKGGPNPGGGPGSSPTPAASPGSTLPASPSPSVSLPAPNSSANAQPASVLAAHVQPDGIIRFALPALLILGGLAALGGSSVLAGSVNGGIAAQLRRLGRAATRSRLYRWRKP